ncbi:MAG: alcohol dehydrogenase family protein [Anaerolineae bacterium]
MNDIPATMTGVQLTGHGGLDKLVLRTDLPVPTPGPSDVLIKVAAAGVNNTDINTRIGWYSKSEGNSSDAGWSGNALQFPGIQGADVCGRIVAVGAQVHSGRLNERVLVEPLLREAGGQLLEAPWYFGSECDGGFAEYAVVAARHAHKINSRFSDVELASIPCSWSTAENLLTRASVVADEVVLVTGASGGVGSAAVQLARARRARVIAVTSSGKSDRVLSLGAEQTVSRNESVVLKLGKNSVDVVVDLVAGKQWPKLLEVLKPFGRYVAAGAIAGPFVELDVRTLYLKDLTLLGCTVLDEGVFENLIKRIEAEEVRPVVSGTFPLAQIAEAQTQFETKQHVGKLVIDLASA